MPKTEEFERKNPMDTRGSSLRMFKKDDPEMPPEFREFMIKLLKYAHVENNANPHYKVLLANIAYAGLRFAPDGRAMTIEAEIIKQEVNHGQIVAKIIKSLGEDPFIDKEIGQYAFRIPLESWIDVSWFHGLIDRVGLYVGIEWMGSTYEPLAEVSDQLEKDEFFHASAGMGYIKQAVRTADGKKEAQDQLHKWWMLNITGITLRDRIEVTSFFDLVLVWNKGISYGLFQQESFVGRLVLASFSFFAVVALAVWLARAEQTRLTAIAIGLVMGGGLCNSFDRLIRPGVADFFALHAFGFHWYIFNVADIAIVAGVAALLYDAIFVRS